MNTDIYCNESIIRLQDFRPAAQMEDGLQIQYPGKKALQDLIYKFEKTDGGKVLSIWSDDKYSQLVKAFFALHERVDAAGGIVFNEHGEILFIHRKGKWDLPKGKISSKDKRKAKESKTKKNGKSGESSLNEQIARIAAIREVKEETGLKNLVISSELPSTYHIYFSGLRRIVKHTRWFRMEGTAGDSLKPQISEGIIIARWIPENSLSCVFLHTYESLKPLIKFVEAHQ